MKNEHFFGIGRIQSITESSSRGKVGLYKLEIVGMTWLLFFTHQLSFSTRLAEAGMLRYPLFAYASQIRHNLVASYASSSPTSVMFAVSRTCASDATWYPLENTKTEFLKQNAFKWESVQFNWKKNGLCE